MAAEEEIWKDIPGYEGYYQVSSFGRVKSLSRIIYNDKGKFISKDKILKQRPNGRGYVAVALYVNKKRVDIKTHQAVAIAFLGFSPQGNNLVINHIDGDGTNNKISNLEIVTQRDNSSVCFRNYKRKLSSIYPGVYYDKAKRGWVAQAQINKKHKYIGLFNDEKMAYNSYIKYIKLNA